MLHCDWHGDGVDDETRLKIPVRLLAVAAAEEAQGNEEPRIFEHGGSDRRSLF